MREISDRLKKLYAGSSARAFALKADISPATFNEYIKNGRMPSIDVLIKIVKVTHVSYEWLLTGEGDIYGGSQPSSTINRNLMHRVIETIERVLEQTKNISLTPKQKTDIIILFYDEYIKALSSEKTLENIYETMDKTIEMALKTRQTK